MPTHGWMNWHWGAAVTIAHRSSLQGRSRHLGNKLIMLDVGKRFIVDVKFISKYIQY